MRPTSSIGVTVLGLDTTSTSAAWAIVHLSPTGHSVVQCGLIRVRTVHGESRAMRELAALLQLVVARDTFETLVRVKSPPADLSHARVVGITDVLAAQIGHVLDVDRVAAKGEASSSALSPIDRAALIDQLEDDDVPAARHAEVERLVDAVLAAAEGDAALQTARTVRRIRPNRT